MGGGAALWHQPCDLREGGTIRPGWLIAQEMPEIGSLGESSNLQMLVISSYF